MLSGWELWRAPVQFTFKFKHYLINVVQSVLSLRWSWISERTKAVTSKPKSCAGAVLCSHQERGRKTPRRRSPGHRGEEFQRLFSGNKNLFVTNLWSRWSFWLSSSFHNVSLDARISFPMCDKSAMISIKLQVDLNGHADVQRCYLKKGSRGPSTEPHVKMLISHIDLPTHL